VEKKKERFKCMLKDRKLSVLCEILCHFSFYDLIRTQFCDNLCYARLNIMFTITYSEAQIYLDKEGFMQIITLRKNNKHFRKKEL
jgi:hypothetical protein